MSPRAHTPSHLLRPLHLQRTPVTANPVKLGLAVTSILMDFIFVIQHYVLYAEKRRPGPCPLSLRRVRALLRALSRAPERLPPEIAEDLLLCLSDHGFDVDVPKVRSRDLQRRSGA